MGKNRRNSRKKRDNSYSFEDVFIFNMSNETFKKLVKVLLIISVVALSILVIKRIWR